MDGSKKLHKLSAAVLRSHRARWRNAGGLFIDEVSMVSPDQLLQVDVRVRQATQCPDFRFGRLLTVLSGDFLQLPPVKKLTLATPVDKAGFVPVSKKAKADDDSDDEEEQVTADARQ